MSATPQLSQLPPQGALPDELAGQLLAQWPGAVFLFRPDAKLLWLNAEAARQCAEHGIAQGESTAGSLLLRLGLLTQWQRFLGSAEVTCTERRVLAMVGASPQWIQYRFQRLQRAGLTSGIVLVGELLPGSAIADADASHPSAQVPERRPLLNLPAGEIDAALTATGTVIWDVRISDWTAEFSSSFYHLLGVAPVAGVTARSVWRDRVHPEDGARVDQAFQRHILGQTPFFEEEYRLRHADGRWLWVLSRAQTTYRDDKGNPMRVTGITVDISQRRDAELALRESEERFRLATASANGVVYEADLPSKHTVMHGLEKLTGYADEPRWQSLAGWMNLVHQEDRERLQATIDRHRRTCEQFEMTYRLLHRDGRTLYVWHRGMYLRDANGAPKKAVGIIEDVTVPVTTKQELRRSEFRLRAVAEMSPGYIFQVTVTSSAPGYEIFVSNAFDRVMGGSHEQFLQRGAFHTFCDAASRPLIERAFDRMQAGLRSDTLVRGFNLRGEEKWLRIQSIPVYEQRNRRRSGTIGAVHDVTREQRAAQALHESQLVLQTLAATSPTQLALFDVEGRCRFANYSLSGRPVEEIAGRTLEELLPAEAGARARAKFQRLLATGQGIDSVEELVLHGGSRRTFEVRMRPVMSGSDVVGVVSNITDITEERRRRDSLNLQALIIDTMKEGVLLIDGEATILLTNPALDEMFGYPRGALLGKRASVLSAAGEEDFMSAFGRLVEGVRAGGAPSLELTCRRADGSRLWAACIATGVDIAGERRMVLVINDTTERKRLEREVLQIATREQQRIGGDLHDGLGQQLTGVALLLRGLSRRLPPESSSSGPRDVDRIIRLVNEAIETTRALARGLSPVSAGRNGLAVGLQELVNQTLERYQVHLSMQYGLPEDLMLDENTATQLYRIAQEAVVNAIKHGRARRVAIQLRLERELVDLLVADDGDGFDLHRVSPTGTGLKIMRFRAQAAGGYLAVESAPGAGTTLRCRCPVRPDGAYV